MSGAAVRIGLGTRFVHDGRIVEIVEMVRAAAGDEVVLKSTSSEHMLRVSLRELLTSDRLQLVPDSAGPAASDPEDLAAVVLTQLTESEREVVRARAAYVREVLTGFRAGARELAEQGEPRPEYAPEVPLYERYAAKAAELGVVVRTVQRWVRDFKQRGEAGLAPRLRTAERGHGQKVDQALDGHRARGDDRAHRRVDAVADNGDRQDECPRNRAVRRRRGEGAEPGDGVPADGGVGAAASDVQVERQAEPGHRGRPDEAYGKLRPTRPGEYVLMDSTRLDVFALDPVTLRWINCELTVAMDWYTRCVTGIRLTPVSTKAVDVASVLFQVFRPRGPACTARHRRADRPPAGRTTTSSTPEV